MSLKTLKIKKRYLLSVACTIVLLITLILVKGITHGHFRTNALKWSEKSMGRNNLVDRTIISNKANVMIIQLNSSHIIKSKNIETIAVDPQKILEKEYLRKILKYKGLKVLDSNDKALSARMWMLLSQVGVKDLYILAE
jgi:hypothetical protein